MFTPIYLLKNPADGIKISARSSTGGVLKEVEIVTWLFLVIQERVRIFRYVAEI
jgi:hypothetical protein